METILTSLKAGIPHESLIEFRFPYFGSLNKIINLEPNDALPSGEPSFISGCDNHDDKPLTHLSSDPSQFEKDLRTLVLDLYSEHGPDDLIGLSSNKETFLKSAIDPFYEDVFNWRDTSNSTIPSSVGSSLQDTVKAPILLKYQETALIDKHVDIVQSGLAKSEDLTLPIHVSQTINSTGGHDCRYETRLKSFQELQQNLQNFELTHAPELSRDRYGSCESRSFSDSGIHLEFLSFDTEIIDSDSRRNCNYSSHDCNDGVDGKESKRVFEEPAMKAMVYISEKAEEGLTLEDESEDLLKKQDNYKVEALSECDQSSNGPSPELVSTATSIFSCTPQKIVRGQIAQSNDVLMCKSSYNGTVDEITSKQNRHLQLELANMEGRLESLSTDYKGVLQEKQELQARLTAMEDKVNNDRQKDLSSSDEKMEERIEKESASLKTRIIELQQDVDAKDRHINDAEERLKVSKKDIEKLQKTLLVLKAEFSSKTSDAELLQQELENMRKTVTEAQAEHKEKLNENEVLYSDMSTLVKAKTWLLKQLEIANDTHVKLEFELSEFKSFAYSQSKHVENLKLENALSSKQMAETQDKAIAEKARLLEHLEKVEEDLVNQDSAFRQMQEDKERVQRELSGKIESLQNENALLLTLAESAKKLQDELEKSINQANTKTRLLKKLQEEKHEVDQHLKVAKSINEVNEKKINALNNKLEKNEKQLKVALSEVDANEAYVNDLKNKNSVLEESIKQAQEEKEALDSAVQLLRVELDKVERRFKVMKRELISKTNCLEEVTRQKDGFVDELRILRDEMEEHTSLLKMLRDTIRMRDESLTLLHNEKIKILLEVRALKGRLENTRTSFEGIKREKEDFRKQLQNSKSRVCSLEKRLHESSSEKGKLEGELESSQNAARDQEISFKSLNLSLQRELSEIQNNLQNEVTRHRDEAINLGQEVEYFKRQLQETHKQHKNEILELKDKVLKVEASKTQIEANTRKKFKDLLDSIVSEVKENHKKILNEKEQHLDSAKQEKEELFFKYTELEEKAKNTFDVQKDRITALEKELGFARKVLSEQRAEIENLSMISIESEREKGRMAGLKMSQKTLRDHCAKMEQSAASRESKISELNSLLGTLQREKDLLRKETNRKIGMLETTIADNNDMIDELRLGLESERNDSAQLRIRVKEREEEAETLLQQLTSAKLDLESTNDKYEKCVQELKNSEENLRVVKLDVRNSKILASKIENKYKIFKEQEKVKADLAASTEWKVRQSRKELDYAKEQLRVSDERHKMEIENLKTAFQVAKGEATYLRRELAMARKSKCENQEKFFSSRDEVLTTRQEAESVKQELFLASQQLRYLKSAILKSRDITEIQEFVKSEEGIPPVPLITTESVNHDVAYSKSPLVGLRNCMSLLRNQISSLQEQMNEHTDAVCSTASSWRSLEKNVQILQTDCPVSNKKGLLFPERETMK